MTVDVQYKCYMTKHQNFYEEPSLVPLLLVRYRKNGKKLWHTFKKMSIDYFSWQFFRKEYYDNFEGAIWDWSDYSRLTTFQNVLEKEFNSSMDEYVKFIVQADMVMIDADMEESQECMGIAKSFLTNGWDSTTLKIENNENSER